MKPGDRVLWTQFNSFSGKTRRVVTVERVTPSGQVKLEGYDVKFKNGEQMGSHGKYSTNSSTITLLTPEMEEEVKRDIYRSNLAKKLSTVDFSQYSLETLIKVKEILDDK